MPPHATGPVPLRAERPGPKRCTNTKLRSLDKSRRTRAQALTVIGAIEKSHTSRLRIAISEWRGERKLELHETTRIVGETYFPSGAPLTITIDKVPDLIELLRKVVQR